MPSTTNLETPPPRWTGFISGLCLLDRRDLRLVREVVDPRTVSADADLVEHGEAVAWTVCEVSPQDITVPGYVCPEKTADMRLLDAATLVAFLPQNAPILLDHGDRFELVDGSHRIARATELDLPTIPLLVGKASSRVRASDSAQIFPAAK